MKQDEFIASVWEYYNKNRRSFEWRELPTSYNVLLSEFMLQQTQTARVVTKFAEFKEAYPTIIDLANTTWEDLLSHWVGLGYNRRARNLHRTAQAIRDDFDGEVPKDKQELLSLPGIGDYTSSAIRAFAFNIADPFIETNIRTVYLHHFFRDQLDIHDKDILDLVDQTMDRSNPREWYWALMDYGVHIKQTYGNPNSRSKHYSKQSKFKGSTRELRSYILKSILGNKSVSHEELHKAFEYDKRAPQLIEAMVKEGMINYNGTHFTV
jgi:A/G-specific adenine glycosylase